MCYFSLNPLHLGKYECVCVHLYVAMMTFHGNETSLIKKPSVLIWVLSLLEIHTTTPLKLCMRWQKFVALLPLQPWLCDITTNKQFVNLLKSTKIVNAAEAIDISLPHCFTWSINSKRMDTVISIPHPLNTQKPHPSLQYQSPLSPTVYSVS